MAKVTQIDYQNALYDIEDTDAQSKISDLQTAMANTYTKAQVDTKFDNYYDKNQSDRRFQHFPNLSRKSAIALKGYGANPSSFTATESGMGVFYCWLAGGYSPNNAIIKINNIDIAQLFASSDVSDTFSFTIKAGDVVTCVVPSSGFQSTFVGLYFFPFD